MSKKKIITIFLSVILIISIIVFIIFKLTEDKNKVADTTTVTEQQEDKDIIEESKSVISPNEKTNTNEFDFSEVEKEVMVETATEYKNQQISNIDKWNVAFKNQQASIKTDLWTNEKTQKDFIKCTNELLKESKRIQNLNCKDTSVVTIKMQFKNATKYLIRELETRLVVLESMKQIQELNEKGIDTTDLVNGVQTDQDSAETSHAQGLQWFQKALDALQKLEV